MMVIVFHRSTSTAVQRIPNDARNLALATREEVAALQASLERTRHNFHRQSGIIPSRAPPEKNYFSQWGFYQTQFNGVWRNFANDYCETWTGG